MPAPYPQEFRVDVVAVARGRGDGVTLKQVAEDFGISEATLSNWLKAADVQAGVKADVTSGVATELKALRRRAKLLEPENEVQRRAAAYLHRRPLNQLEACRLRRSKPHDVINQRHRRGHRSVREVVPASPWNSAAVNDRRAATLMSS